MSDLQTGAWEQAWKESERGWGIRPDGYWYYATEAVAKEDTAQMFDAEKEYSRKIYGNATPDEYSYPDGPPRFRPVSAELAKQIAESGKAFRMRREA